MVISAAHCGPVSDGLEAGFMAHGLIHDPLDECIAIGYGIRASCLTCWDRRDLNLPALIPGSGRIMARCMMTWHSSCAEMRQQAHRSHGATPGRADLTLSGLFDYPPVPALPTHLPVAPPAETVSRATNTDSPEPKVEPEAASES